MGQEIDRKTTAIHWVGILFHHCVVHPIVVPASVVLRDIGCTKLSRLAGLVHDVVCILAGECDGTI